MKVTVDRIEEGFFVCISDGGNVINVPVHDIPFEVNECDILDITISDGKVTDARYLRRYARRQKYKPPGKRTQ